MIAMFYPLRPRRLCLSLGLVASLAAFTASVARAELLALVIGIDRYDHLPHLPGAVNDARDMPDRLAALPGAEVTTFPNEEATRARIPGTRADVAARAGPGDTIVVTFAGHGSHEPRPRHGTAGHGPHESFLLSDVLPGTTQGRIRSDAIAAMIARSPEIAMIVSADSCHSGTATRATAFDGACRLHDPGVPFRRSHPVAAPGALPPSPTFLAAVGDGGTAPEVPIGGTVRGAMSHAFAGGLPSTAETDHDGVVTKGELERHVRTLVKGATAGRQMPRVEPAGQGDRPLVHLAQSDRPPPPPQPFALPFAALPVLPIRSEGAADAGTILHSLDGARVMPAGEDDIATLVVDLDRRLIRSAQGDILRRLQGRSAAGFRRQIQETVDKFRGMQAIRAAQSGGTLDIWFPLGDALYFADEPVRLIVDGRQERHLSLFNVTSDNAVEWLYPVTPSDDPAPDPAVPLALEVFVLPPFGAQHLVAVETPDPQDAVLRALNRHAGGTDFRAFWTDMHHALRDRPHRVAVHAFFTRRPGDR